MVLYRWLGASPKGVPEEAANHVHDQLEAALEGAGLRLERMDGAAFHRWMLTWFNPRPTTDPDDPHRFYDRVVYPGDAAISDLPAWDFAEDLIHRCPRGDVESGFWYLDGLPHRALPVEEIRRAPQVGHLTGEMPRAGGKAFNAVMDQLPEDTEMVLTIVATPQEPLEDHINMLHNKAHGDSVLATSVRDDCDYARQMLGKNHKLYRSALVFYIRGDDERDLEQRTLTLTSQLQTANLKPVAAEDEIAPLNTWLRWLPMAFDPQQDRKGWYTRLNYVQHLANLAPVFGRSRGTLHPGLSFFNRGGGTFGFDPLHIQDRAKNGHMLVFGPTGAGKSATLNAVFSQVMALRRPRLFIIEVGNSFGLLGDDFERNGLSVNKVKLAPGVAPPLPLFSEAHRLLDDTVKERRKVEDHQDKWSDEPAPPDGGEDNDEEDDRDILGEMELTARLMITGGDPKEEAEFRRADRRLVRDAIYRAAERSASEGRQCLTQDVRDALSDLSVNPRVPEPRRARAHEMAEAMGLEEVRGALVTDVPEGPAAEAGMESGDDEVLRRINKGETWESTRSALEKIKQAGLTSSVMVLNGLGGEVLSRQHAINTATRCNETQPDYLSTLVVSFPQGEERFRAGFGDDFVPLSQQGLFEEIRVFLEHLELESTIFRSDHASNYLVLKGTLGRVALLLFLLGLDRFPAVERGEEALGARGLSGAQRPAGGEGEELLGVGAVTFQAKEAVERERPGGIQAGVDHVTAGLAGAGVALRSA